jgi:hypothetical protein
MVPPVDKSSLIQMTIKQEHEEANTATLGEITDSSLKWAAWKAERRERIVREEAEEVERNRLEKERKKAAIDAELQALMAKKAELNAPVEPKMEPVEETGMSAGFLADFACLPGFHMEGQFLGTRTSSTSWNMSSVKCQMCQKKL